MSRSNRGIDPTRALCRECAGELQPTALGVAHHRAKHLEWKRANSTRLVGRDEWNNLIALRQAWRDYASELEALADHLRGRIGDVTEERDDLQYRHDHLEAELFAANADIANHARGTV